MLTSSYFTEGRAPTIAQSLGVAQADAKAVQEAMKPENLDARM